MSNLYFEELGEPNHLKNDRTFTKHAADILRNNHGIAKTEKYIGVKENGIRFRADIVLPDKMIVIDTKLKNNTGTPDEKILDKALWLNYACEHWHYKKGIILYGGTHWNKKVIVYLRDVTLPKYFTNVSMIRYEDDIELKNI